MSSDRLFLDRDGRHQSPSPLHRLHQIKPLAFSTATFYHRTVDYLLTACVSRGGKRNAYLVRVHKQHITQTVLYLGPEPLRLERTYISPSMDFRFEIVNLREYEAEPLLASQDWADNALALLAKGEPERVLVAAMSRLRAMKSEDRNWAASTLLLLSGILGIEQTVNERLKEVGMINVMENKVLGPLIQQQFEQGERKGRSEGKQEGMQDLLHELLAEKFGSLPAWALQRLQAASAEDLHAWAKRVLHSTTLEDTLR